MQPAVYDGFGGHFGIVEIVGHQGAAAHGDFADAFGARIYDFHFHAWERLADGVGAEWFQIIDRDRGAGFGAAVAIAYRDSQIVEKLQRFGFGESAADEEGAQLAAEGLVNLRQ